MKLLKYKRDNIAKKFIIKIIFGSNIFIRYYLRLYYVKYSRIKFIYHILYARTGSSKDINLIKISSRIN